jgi:hypothetical protein
MFCRVGGTAIPGGKALTEPCINFAFDPTSGDGSGICYVFAGCESGLETQSGYTSYAVTGPFPARSEFCPGELLVGAGSPATFEIALPPHPGKVSGVELINLQPVCAGALVGKEVRSGLTGAAPVRLSTSCPHRHAYSTTSGRYCAWRNLDVPATPSLALHSCFSKCHPLVTGAGPAPAGCEGFEFEADDASTNALCLPREECEELCDAHEDCGGIDFVKGKPRCFLNEAGACAGAPWGLMAENGGQAPPTGWFHPPGADSTATGINYGARFADGYVPPRQLHGGHPELSDHLFVSNAFDHAAKNPELFVSYSTTSSTFCAYQNLDLSKANYKAELYALYEQLEAVDQFGLAEQYAPTALVAEMGLDFVNGIDKNHAFYASREICEAFCNLIPECGGFDMHKIHNLCYFNELGNCTAELMVANSSFYDYVEKTQQPPCSVDIGARTCYSAPQIPAQNSVLTPSEGTRCFIDTTSDPGAGQYVQVAQTKFMSASGDVLQGATAVGKKGCGWEVVLSSALNGAPIYNTYDSYKSGCRPKDADYTPLDTHWGHPPLSELDSAVLTYHGCPPIPGSSAEFFCHALPLCGPLSYCVISTARMDVEQYLLRYPAVGPARRPLCADLHLYEISEVVQKVRNAGAKVIASTTRVDLIYDFAKFGSQDIKLELARDGGGGFRVRVQDLGPAILGVVTLASPDATAQEQGGTYPIPDGFSALADVIRVERYDENGTAAVEGAFSFELHVPTSALGWSLFRVLPDGTYVDVFVTGEATVGTGWLLGPLGNENVTGTYTHEPDWYLVTFKKLGNTYPCGAVDLVVAYDLDECRPVNPCDENAHCLNTVGGFTCACKPGWEGDGYSCLAQRFFPSDVTLRVELASDLSLGWRLREIEMFKDAKCGQKLVSTDIAFTWHAHEDRYCIGNNYVPAALVKKKCKKEDEGYRGPDDPYALCLDREECKAECARESDCAGVDVNEVVPRCYMNLMGGTCVEQAATNAMGTDYEFAYIAKETLQAVTSSPAYESHPVELVADGSMNSEWWTGKHRLSSGDAFVDFHFAGHGIPRSARVHQNPRHGAAKYFVELQLAPASTDTPTLIHVQYEGSLEQQIDARGTYTKTVLTSVENDKTVCVDLSCGRGGLAPPLEGNTLAKIPAVPSDCQCKQLCLDNIDEGCRSWSLYKASDTNFWDDKGFQERTACYLLTLDFSAAMTGGTAHEDYISGGVDLVVSSMTPSSVHAGNATTLSINGVGITNKMRIKVIEADKSCEDVAVSVQGLSCSSTSVCGPAPSVATSRIASWPVVFSETPTPLAVCVCADKCYSTTQYTKLPYTIDILPGDVTMPDDSVDISAASGLYARGRWQQAGSLAAPVTVEGAQIACTGKTVASCSTVATSLEVVEGDDCTSAAVFGITVTSVGSDQVEEDGRVTESFSFSVMANESVSAGIYTVCFTADGSTADAGTFVVSRRVDIGKNWVISPDGASSIEVTGENLNWAKDRIMLVGCEDVCGVNEGTAGAVFPPGAYIEAWNTFSPVAPPKAPVGRKLLDLPEPTSHDFLGDLQTNVDVDPINPPPKSKCGAATTAATLAACLAALPDEPNYAFVKEPNNPFLVENQFTEFSGRFCAAAGLGPVASSRGAALFAGHKCASKCPCTVSGCYCDGVDPEDADSLCLSKHECMHLCLLIDECTAVSMNNHRNRCFLHGSNCSTQVMLETSGPKAINAGKLGMDPDYSVYAKGGAGLSSRVPQVVEGSLVNIDWEASSRGDLVSDGEGSSDSVLRFAPLELKPGTYKACFCDAAASDGPCAEAKDYSVELGKVHVSGLSCLLENTQLRTATCYEQVYGGLSCATFPARVPASVAPADLPPVHAPPDHAPSP